MIMRKKYSRSPLRRTGPRSPAPQPMVKSRSAILKRARFRERSLATCASSVNDEWVDPLRIWDARTGTLQRDFAAEKIHGPPMALSPDGSIVATGGKSIKLWDVRTSKLLRELFGHLKRTQSITF